MYVKREVWEGGGRNEGGRRAWERKGISGRELGVLAFLATDNNFAKVSMRKNY